MTERTYLEFFAGGGMVRAGLGSGWRCGFANDIDTMKCATYRDNWGAEHLVEGDVATVHWSELGSGADLAWASFPCQDLSLAGAGAGIGLRGDAAATRSGAFWNFWRLMLDLGRYAEMPKVVVLENVPGILTANGGADFAAIGQCLADAGYNFGALQIDAVRFVPQSRPRIFIVAARGDIGEYRSGEANDTWHPPTLRRAVERLSPDARTRWRWWSVPTNECSPLTLVQIVDDAADGVAWHSVAETERLVAMMAPVSRERLRCLIASGERQVATIYRRTRSDSHGYGQRAELRADGIAGCLRTPGGGSSRQTLMIVDGANVRSRLLSPREAARLMGLPEDYRLPSRYNDAYQVAGDGVVVPVVRHLAAHLLEPLLVSSVSPFAIAAE